ncbi:type II toxin-antitoxin system prevent-host-death family antitoxin [Sphingomonas sp. AR_OL41]|jgi:prevent-host-death family protein|uniref:type II toxin-antitoxin system Phd/YefM family antitoxin n=1 Tax=Sphingomonas sp. AR_OL41 TaxID=3042729 RepID=UPI0024800280|nr:type II toxin-antitoxin system prevent-host-death family antitoxin [Sphingomonas sp. AR_OL41]MDH7973789.1 type II toxin-antitoxin system prevent-host-death family antitoxin [Sphingomonas sp. AR_OL41]
MEMSVREARAQFASALAAAERGERVTITKNGKAVAELGPPTKRSGFDWERAERWRKEHGYDRYSGPPLDEKWLEEFNDPAWTREIFGAEYFDDEPGNTSS